jgi:hypothetical protein
VAVGVAAIAALLPCLIIPAIVAESLFVVFAIYIFLGIGAACGGLICTAWLPFLSGGTGDVLSRESRMAQIYRETNSYVKSTFEENKKIGDCADASRKIVGLKKYRKEIADSWVKVSTQNASSWQRNNLLVSTYDRKIDQIICDSLSENETNEIKTAEVEIAEIKSANLPAQDAKETKKIRAKIQEMEAAIANLDGASSGAQDCEVAISKFAFQLKNLESHANLSRENAERIRDLETKIAEIKKYENLSDVRRQKVDNFKELKNETFTSEPRVIINFRLERLQRMILDEETPLREVVYEILMFRKCLEEYDGEFVANSPEFKNVIALCNGALELLNVPNLESVQ